MHKLKVFAWLGLTVQMGLSASLNLEKYTRGYLLCEAIARNEDPVRVQSDANEAAVAYYLKKRSSLQHKLQMTDAQRALFDEGAFVADWVSRDADISLTAAEEHLLTSFCCMVGFFDIAVAPELVAQCRKKACIGIADRNHVHATCLAGTSVEKKNEKNRLVSSLKARLLLAMDKGHSEVAARQKRTRMARHRHRHAANHRRRTDNHTADE